MRGLEEVLTKEFKIMPNKILKINNEFYIEGEDDLFFNRSLQQIQYILFCLCLCDNRIQVHKDKTKNTEYMPKTVTLTIKKQDFRVFKFLYGKHLQKFLDLDKKIQIKSKNDEYLFCSLMDGENIYIVMNTDIIKYVENKKYTNVWVGDALLTKRKNSLYLKMKMYKFLDIQSYVEDRDEIELDSIIKIIVSRSEFNRWTKCEHRFKQYIAVLMKSIDSENEFKIVGSYSINGSITFSFTELSLANHIKENGILANKKYVGTSKKKIIKGTW